MHFLSWSMEFGWAVAVQCSLGWLLLGVSRRSSRGASSRANWAAGAGHKFNTEEMMQMLAKFGGHVWPKSTFVWHFHFTNHVLDCRDDAFIPSLAGFCSRVPCELCWYLAKSDSAGGACTRAYQEVSVTRKQVLSWLVYWSFSVHA
jgi:hypothetical protein